MEEPIEENKLAVNERDPVFRGKQADGILICVNIQAEETGVTEYFICSHL